MPTSPIALVLFDVDGVLTDGTVRCSAGGDEGKTLFMRDVDAIFEARRHGLVVGLVTGEDSPWVDLIARRLEVEVVARGAKDKLAAIRRLAEAEGIALDSVCYVGDADRDAPALAAVGLGLAPRDASGNAKKAAAVVLSSAGGRGAVADAVQVILRPRGPSAAAEAPAAGEPATGGDALTAIRRLITESVAVQQAVARTLAPSIVEGARVISRTLAEGGKVLLFGDGGSAAQAEHVAAELVGRFERDRSGLAAIALTSNSSVVTALGNDFGQEELFARQIEALGKPGDVAVAISTSGRSPNVVVAANRARALGLSVVALTGADGGDLRALADVCITVPSSSAARIQEAHTVIIHAICVAVDDVGTPRGGQGGK